MTAPVAPAVDRETLTGIVRLATDRHTVEIEDARWRCRPIHAGGGVTTGGLYRLEGEVDDLGRTRSWSVILKVIRPPAHPGNPEGWDYWKREALAYSSGALRVLPGGVVAPRCFGAVEHGVQGTWLWLEDVKEESENAWSVDDYRAAARHLGGFNGSYTSERPIPAESWWSRRWLRGYAESATSMLTELPALMRHPLIRRLFPDHSVDQIKRLWTERATLLRVLDQLPQTFCHLDAIRRNLFRRSGADRRQTVLVDWAFAGTGAVGQELAALVVGTVLLYGLEPGDLPKLERTALAGYMQGLKKVGWQGDEHVVRLGFAASAALRYTAYVLVRMGILLDDRQRVWAERVLGRPIEHFIDRVVALREYLFGLAAEARSLSS
jgi:phosphotransferase family enzyme